jgi:hypothetical protein
MCRRVAEATRTDPATGRAIESSNKWRAIYISGQIHHSLGEPAEAITEYGRVADRFPDAKETIAYFTRKAIELPEVTTAKPEKGVGNGELGVGEEKKDGGNEPETNPPSPPRRGRGVGGEGAVQEADAQKGGMIVQFRRLSSN